MSKTIPNKRIKRSTKVTSLALPYQKGSFGVINNETFKQGTPNLFHFMQTSTASFIAALFLCLSFFLQGANFAKADFEEIESVTVEVSDTEDLIINTDSESIESEDMVQIDDELAMDNVEEVVDEDVSNANASTDILAESVTEELLDDTTLPDIQAEEDLLTDGSSDSSDTEDDTMDDSDTNTDSSDGSENDVVIDEPEEVSDIVDIQASSTEILEEELPGTTESVSVVQSDSAYTFNREECTRLATGSYYCLKPVEGMLEDALFAAPDEDGDLEIFLVRDGVQSQVTSNQVDDAAPYFDENSNTIVWHRLNNDRFQIVSYEIESGTETLLTNTSENNMEPTRQGEYTVWQRWVDGSWNIILHDGSRETKITNGSGHNVAPYVHGSLVVWNRHGTDGQKTIEMYDMDTKAYVSVPDAEGLSVSNPRMVFVFDSLTPEGDVITKGYDVLAREFIDLDSLPKSLPEEIPNSESTGETRALIQSKPTVKTDVEELTESDLDTAPLGPTPELDPLTLNLSTTTAVVIEAETSTSTTSNFDLVIEPYNVTEVSSSSEQIIE